MFFKGDIIITDPMYIIKCEEDWHRCKYGEKLEALNIGTYLTSGHSDCMASDVISPDTQERLGEFCSDSCMVSVMLLSEVRAYNPDFDRDLESHCYTIIEDFVGEVTLFEEEIDNGEDFEAYFEGKGNKNFKTDWLDD